MQHGRSQGFVFMSQKISDVLRAWQYSKFRPQIILAQAFLIL